jgi:hypothetical protein
LDVFFSLVHNFFVSFFVPFFKSKMLTSSSRVLLSKMSAAGNGYKANASTFRWMSTMTPPPMPDQNDKKRHMSTAAAAAPVETSTAATGGLAQRFLVTAEVTVSKIFPAGFGWQTASIVAANHLGFAPDTLNFAMTTGLGDGLGVLGGHCLFYGAKKALVDSSINMESEFQTGFLLASAAFCSGTAWQPLVDALQGANLSFGGVFAGTWVGCGLAFYGGLRAGRTILSGFMKHINEPTYENSKADASLSVVIGGATGFFVGTDAAYLPDQNFLINVVGIPDGTPDLVGCAIAGSSTSLGFLTSQSVFNVIYPSGKCWND